MALQHIIDKINADADSEVKKIILQAEEEAARLVSEAEQKASGLAGKMAEDGSQQAQKAKERIITMAVLDGKKALLDEKQKILDKVYAEARARLLSMPEKEYRNLMKGMMLKGCKAREAQVVIGTDDRAKLNSRFISDVSKELGGKCKLSIADEKTEMKNGFILRFNSMEMDYSLDSIINSLREDSVDDVAGMLFTK